MRWDAVLELGRVVRGRLIDERGEPLAGWIVNARAMPLASGDARNFWGQRETGEDGAFEIACCPDTLLHLGIVQKAHITDTSQVAFTDVRPDGVARDCVVPDGSFPTASVTGVLRLADGSPAALQVVVRGEERDWGRNGWSDVASGAFRIDGVVPGSYRVTAEDRRGLAIAPVEFELAPHQTLDLGELLAGAPVRFSASILPVAGVDASKLQFSILTDQRSHVSAVTIEELLDGVELSPGRYLLQLRGPCVPDALPFELRPDEPNHLDVVPRPFVLVALDHRLPEGVELPLEVEVTFRDAAGNLVKRDTAYLALRDGQPQGYETVSYHQLPVAGGYAVEVKCAGGLSGGAWIGSASLADGASPSPGPVEVVLR
ncbi:MAG TPA: hypothetical protein VMT18_12570 [Planctomycetota bacterium]|nr:hypothetical protein [Planctomycetota bacterium]